MAELLPVLTFHDLDDSGRVTSFPPGLFRDCLTWLHDRGRQTLALGEAADLLMQGRGFPERHVVLTFDDGSRSVYEVAFPVLARLGMTATVFLTTGEGGSLAPQEGRPLLSRAQIREMAEHGITFGAHTLTHPDLTRVSPDRVERELRDSRAVIEDMLSRPADVFAYPYGRFNPAVRAAAGRHFRLACSDRLGLIARGSDRLALERVDAYYLRSRRLFRLLDGPLFPWYVRARAIPRAVRRRLAGAA